MKKVPTDQLSRPESEVDPEVLAFRSQFDSVSPLDELVRQGAQQMLQTAIETEVQDFLLTHSGRVDEQGRRQVVRNTNGDTHIFNSHACNSSVNLYI